MFWYYFFFDWEVYLFISGYSAEYFGSKCFSLIIVEICREYSLLFCSMFEKFIRNRSSRVEMFFWKHLCQSIFLNKFADPRPVTSSKVKLWHWCFPENFVKILRTFFCNSILPVAASVQSLQLQKKITAQSCKIPLFSGYIAAVNCK